MPCDRQFLAKRRCKLAAVAIALVSYWSSPACADITIYQNDFNEKVGTKFPEWSSSRITYQRRGENGPEHFVAAPRVTNTESPKGGNRFLGEFGGPPFDPTAQTQVDQTISLHLDKLPPHRSVTVSFDLLILKSWDGDSPRYGPDRFSVRRGDPHPLLDATFSNNFKIDADGSVQSYPSAKSRPQTGARSVNTLGYEFFGDSIYRFTFKFSHQSTWLDLSFSSELFEGKGTNDESWGLDNVTVTLATPRTGELGSPRLRVVGNVLEDAGGHTVRLQGVNIPSLEWLNTGENILKSVNVAMRDWHANAIRLPLAQDRWFGKAEHQKDNGKSYRAIVDEVVERVAAQGGYTIIDLHWSDAGEWGQHIGQHRMPDQHALEFWQDAAARFANQPSVLFDLYNEPHDVSWDIWKSGGDVTEKDKKTKTELAYTSPGMQRLLDTVRATGARNVVVAGGLDWAYDLSGIAKGAALDDPKGDGVIYGAHIYPWKKDWDAHVAIIAKRYPVFICEVGCNVDPKEEDPSTWAPKILKYIDEHQWSWTAWCFHTGATPKLLQDWSYRPTTHWGAYVKRALTARLDDRSMLDSLFPIGVGINSPPAERNRRGLGDFSNQYTER